MTVLVHRKTVIIFSKSNIENVNKKLKGTLHIGMMFSVCVATCFMGILAMASAQTAPGHVGRMTCMYNTTTGVMTASMYIFKGSSVVTRAFFTKPSEYDVVYSEDGCQWTGTGTAVDPFTASVEVNSSTNLPPTDQNGCGYQIIDAVEQVYRWTVYSQIQNEHGRQGDIVFSFECSGKGTPDSISAKVIFDGTDNEGVGQRIKPETQMSVLERPSGSNTYTQVLNNGVSIGQLVKLRVELKVKVESLRQAGIDYYGVFPFYCDYRTSQNGSPTLFIQQNGCANNVFSRLLGTGFEFVQFSSANQVNQRWFQTETNAFVLVPSTPANNYYYIRCYVGYCYGTEGRDGRCSDFCGYSTRGRRSLGNADGFDSVSIRVKVNNELYTGNNDEKQTEPATQTVIIIIASVATVILLAVVIGVAVVCCFRRRARHSEREWTDTSTTDSRKQLSFYPSPHQYKYPKF